MHLWNPKTLSTIVPIHLIVTIHHNCPYTTFTCNPIPNHDIPSKNKINQILNLLTERKAPKKFRRRSSIAHASRKRPLRTTYSLIHARPDLSSSSSRWILVTTLVRDRPALVYNKNNASFAKWPRGHFRDPARITGTWHSETFSRGSRAFSFGVGRTDGDPSCGTR